MELKFCIDHHCVLSALKIEAGLDLVTVGVWPSDLFYVHAQA